RRNDATITQTSSENTVGEVQQTATTSSTNSTLRNSLTILQQGGDGNAIDRVEQNRINNSNGQPGNTATLTQGGATSGGGNEIGLVSQDGRGNEATVTQSSSNNELEKLIQDGRGNT